MLCICSEIVAFNVDLTGIKKKRKSMKTQLNRKNRNSKAVLIHDELVSKNQH